MPSWVGEGSNMTPQGFMKIIVGINNLPKGMQDWHQTCHEFSKQQSQGEVITAEGCRSFGSVFFPCFFWNFWWSFFGLPILDFEHPFELSLSSHELQMIIILEIPMVGFWLTTIAKAKNSSVFFSLLTSCTGSIICQKTKHHGVAFWRFGVSLSIAMGMHACSLKGRRRDDLEGKIRRDVQFWMLHLILI